MEPDFEMIIRLKCIQYGLKAPNMLAPKLKALYEICQGSFMSVQSKYQLTLSSFISILRFFYKQITSNESRPNSYTSAINPSANKFGAAKLESKYNWRKFLFHLIGLKTKLISSIVIATNSCEGFS